MVSSQGNHRVPEESLKSVEFIRAGINRMNQEINVHEYSDVEQAIGYVQRIGMALETPAPDIVILDLNPPKGDGVDVLQALRASPYTTHIPIGVMSSSDGDQLMRRVRSQRPEFATVSRLPSHPAILVVQSNLWFPIIHFEFAPDLSSSID